MKYRVMRTYHVIEEVVVDAELAEEAEDIARADKTLIWVESQRTESKDMEYFVE